VNLLFLTQTYPRFAGDTCGPFIRDLARGLVRGGDRVTVLAPHAPEVPARWEDDGVQVRTFRYAPERWELLGYSRSLEKDETIKWGAGAVAPLYWAAARRAVKRELKTGQYDLVHGHWVVPNGLVLGPPSPVVTAAGRVPFAVGLHGSDVFQAEKPGVRQWVGRVLKRARLVTGCSPELVDRVCALGFPRERAAVIPYGVDVEQFSPRLPGDGDAGGWRRDLGIPPEAPLILSVGRMATKKGYQHLMPILGALFEAHPEAFLVLAGGGDRLEEFQKAAEPWKERVAFPGAVYRDRLPDLYRAADLFVLPAVHDRKGNVDGLPNVILEAMASGLPVIASGISGIPLAVEDGVTGLTVPEGDETALLAALRRLLDHPEERRVMGEAGRKKAVADLTWDAVAGRYRAAYQGSG
jgi:glycosyltransferase involved in cell wall biosynthesis